LSTNLSTVWTSLCTSPSMSPDAAATPAGATGPAARSQPAAPGSTGPAARSQPAAPGIRPIAGLCAPLACRQPINRTVRVPGLPLACGVAPGRNGLRAWPRTIRADPGTSYDHVWMEVPGVTARTVPRNHRPHASHHPLPCAWRRLAAARTQRPRLMCPPPQSPSLRPAKHKPLKLLCLLLPASKEGSY